MANYTYCKQKIRQLCMYIQCNEQIHKWYMIAHFWNTMKIAMRWNLKEHSRIVMLLQVAVTNWHVKSAGFIHKPSRELEPRYLSMIPILGAILNLVIFKLTNYLLLFLSNIDHISQLGKAKWHRMRQLKDQTPYQHCSKPGGQPSDLPIQIKLGVFQTRETIWKSGTYKSINKFLASIVMDERRS